MSARRRPGLPSGWTVVRGPLGPSSVEPATTCASCGGRTADAVVGDSFSVIARDGGHRLAPPMPLCESCRRDVIYKRGMLPSWCAACQSWRTFGHHHEAVVVVPEPAAEAVGPEPAGRAV